MYLCCFFCVQLLAGGICHGDGHIVAKPGWWLSSGLTVNRLDCQRNPRKPPRRCGEGAMECERDEEGGVGMYYDECVGVLDVVVVVVGCCWLLVVVVVVVTNNCFLYFFRTHQDIC